MGQGLILVCLLVLATMVFMTSVAGQDSNLAAASNKVKILGQHKRLS